MHKMGSADTVAFNICTFISALFLLEFGADKFIDHTAIVSRRIGVSQALVGLLTAGAEWEEVRPSVEALFYAASDRVLSFFAC